MYGKIFPKMEKTEKPHTLSLNPWMITGLSSSYEPYLYGSRLYLKRNIS